MMRGRWSGPTPLRGRKRPMNVNGKRYVTLYLTDWQMRMFKDFLGVECDHYTFAIDVGAPVLRYKIYSRDKSTTDAASKRMYFTEWQRKEILDETGHECDFIELSAIPQPKYMVHPAVEMLAK
jgi:hypothetical protein